MRKTQMNGLAKLVAWLIVGMVATALAAAVGLLVLASPAAHADPSEVTATEVAFARSTHEATCGVFAQYPTAAGMSGIIATIEGEGFDARQTGHIIGYTVSNYCPSQLPAARAAMTHLAALFG